MPSVESQIHRLGAKRKGFEAKTRQGANEKSAFKNAWHGPGSKYRGVIYPP